MNDPELPRPAPAQLRELIAATRPDWDDAAVADALARAHTAGMTWGQVLTTVGKLLADPKSTPAELADTAPRPWRATSPGDYDRGAALARAALRETHHITDDERGRAR